MFSNPFQLNSFFFSYRRFTIELDPNFKVLHKIGLVMKTETGMYMKAIPR